MKRKSGLAAALLICLAVAVSSEIVLRQTSYFPSPLGVYDHILTRYRTILARDAGKVGVGTEDPRSSLHVHKAGGQGSIRITGASDFGHTWSALYLDDLSADTEANVWFFANKKESGTPQQNSLHVGRFGTDGLSRVYLAIQENGEVGLGGILDPQAALDVAGDARVNDVYVAAAPRGAVWVRQTKSVHQILPYSHAQQHHPGCVNSGSATACIAACHRHCTNSDNRHAGPPNGVPYETGLSVEYSAADVACICIW